MDRLTRITYNQVIFVSFKAIDAAVKALKQGSVSQGDVTRAKEQLKAAVLSELDSNGRLVSDIGQQAVLLGQVQSATQLAAAIDGVSVADVNAVGFIILTF